MLVKIITNLQMPVPTMTMLAAKSMLAVLEPLRDKLAECSPDDTMVFMSEDLRNLLIGNVRFGLTMENKGRIKCGTRLFDCYDIKNPGQQELLLRRKATQDKTIE